MDDNKQQVKNIMDKANLMQMLMDSERFKFFFEMNYVLMKNVDPETQEESMVLVENPPEIVEQLMLNRAKEAAKESLNKVELISPDVLKDIEKRKGRHN